MHNESNHNAHTNSNSGRRDGARLPALVGLSGLVALAGLAILAASATAAPAVTIDSPGNTDIIASGTVPINLTITGFTLDCAAVGGVNALDTGHYHVMLDDVYQKFDCRATTWLANVADGPHTIMIELANNDHTLLSINDSVNIVIQPNSPRVAITSPAAANAIAAVNSSSVVFSVFNDNFTLDSSMGPPNVAGHGHYHVFINGLLVAMITTPTYSFSGLSAGVTYQFTFELHNNDHSLYLPWTYDSVWVKVPAGAPAVYINASVKGQLVNATSLSVPLTILNYTLDAASMGGANVAGQGHYHYSIDGALVGMDTTASISLLNLAEGSHTLLVELVQNSHAALPARVFDSAQFVILTGAPKITITSPASGASPNTTSLWVNVTVANFTLDAAAIGSSTNVVGTGHYHILIDGQYVAAGGGAQVAVYDLTAGPHTITAELRNNNHAALTWPAFDTISITIAPNPPWINITGPVLGSSNALNWTILTVQVTNFTLDPTAIGSSTNVAGRGHYHMFVDGAYVGNTGATSAVIIDLTPGSHTIRVELRNNNHSPLADPVWDEVTVTVVGAKPSITIAAPTTGAIIWGNSTNVTVTVVNFTLDVAAIGSSTNVNGRGHWHVYVDGVYRTASAALTVMVMDLTPGDHFINVSLNSNDHSPLGSPQTASVLVHVAKIPSIRITAPTSGVEITGSSLTITVEVTDLTLDAAAIGSAPVAGRGHYHIFVDGLYVGASAGATVNVTNLTVGNHTVSVRPFNNDHTEIPGTTAFSIAVSVKAPAPPPPKGFLPGFGLVEALAAVGAAAIGVAGASRRRTN